MKETILDVLLYLFEHYFYDDPDAVRDRDSLQNGLIQAGFSPSEINKAFDWLDELARQRPAIAAPRLQVPVLPGAPAGVYRAHARQALFPYRGESIRDRSEATG